MGWGLLAIGGGIAGYFLAGDPRWLILFIPGIPLLGFAIHAALRARS
jgi:hypothetical protein